MGDIDSTDHIRLHIAPFNADLYDRIIPPSLQPLARHRSFHEIQTFPERGYGFVELPAAEAQKLKKKLNGMTLKGSKMSVEEARPAKKRKSDVEVDGEESERKKAKRERKERKEREEGVLVGHELEPGRRVKRGWTGDDSGEKEGKEKKRKAQDDEGERKLRFKTSVPPNKVPLETELEKKKKKKDNKDKDKKGRDDGKTVVQEFKKHKKTRQDIPTVNGVAPGSLTYDEGKGWTNEDGHVVEPERKSKKPKKKCAESSEKPCSPDLEDTVAGAEREQTGEAMAIDTPISDAPPNNKAADSSPDHSSEEEAVPIEDQPPTHPKEVHPLEALFKRPAPSTTITTKTAPSANTTPNKPRPAPIDTSFSFFGAEPDADADADDDTDMVDGGGAGGMPPVTPHTKQDLEWRSLRSAAPTPDTAAIGRKFSWALAAAQDEADEADEDDGGAGDWTGPVEGGVNGVVDGGEGEGEGREESAFRKWFFENRGDLNRGWKKRRREERKVKRQRENRRLGGKVA